MGLSETISQTKNFWQILFTISFICNTGSIVYADAENEKKTPIYSKGFGGLYGYPNQLYMNQKGNPSNIKRNNPSFSLFDTNNSLPIANTKKDIKKILNAISKKPINFRDKEGNTLLHFAIKEGKVEKALFLIKKGIDVNTENKKGIRPLHLASQTGNREIFTALLNKGADINAKDIKGNTPLHWTIAKEQTEMALHAIGNGANVNAENKQGIRPLHLASLKGNTKMIWNLINKWVKQETHYQEVDYAKHISKILEAKDKEGKTALFYAKDIYTAMFLIKEGANLKVKDKKGNSLLHSGLITKNKGQAFFYITMGDMIHTKNNLGRTPLHVAQDPETTLFLIQKGANLETRDGMGETALHLASRNANIEKMETLIKEGANIKAMNTNGRTALHTAGNLSAVELLMAHGANVNTKDNNGNTALHLHTDKKIIQFLIKKGANKSIKNNDGEVFFKETPVTIPSGLSSGKSSFFEDSNKCHRLFN